MKRLRRQQLLRRLLKLYRTNQWTLMTVMMNLLRLKAETALLFPMPLDLQRMLQRIFQEKVMKVAMKLHKQKT